MISGPGHFSFVNNGFPTTPTISDTTSSALPTVWDANYDTTAQNYINNTSALLVDPLGVTASSSAATGTADMVTNGDFSGGAASWTVGAGWAIVTEATATASSGLLSQNIGATTQTYYSVTYTVTGYSAGTIRVGIGGVNAGPHHAANGTYTDIIGTGAGANGILYLIPAAFTGVVDDVHVYSYSRVGNINLGQLKFGKIVYSAATNPVPTCNAGLSGTLIEVSDATAPTYNGAYTSGGAVKVPLFCDGTAWSTH